MKRLLVHWVEMRTLEVPDDAPERTDEFIEWMVVNRCDRESLAVKADERDFEIVDVPDI
jgi:hypothetical protein